MKDLRTHLYEQMGQTLGFTMDDELAADYIYAFENDDWGINPHDVNLKDIDMWWSLGTKLNKYVLQHSKFTGCIGETTDELEVIKFAKFDNILLQLCETLDNAQGGKNPIDPDWGHFVICYKDHKPIYIPDLDGADWKEYAYAINPRAKWKNIVSKTNLEWIIWNDTDEVWIRNKSAYKSLIDYTGWSIWKDGKCEAGSLAMMK